MKSIEGQIVDIINREIYPGSIVFENGKIIQIQKHETAEKQYIMPGFVDAHIHIESSMLPPVEYARMAMRNGTVAIVTDPHEIANVCGVPGIRFMMDEADRTPLKICFAIPSCVPATPLCSAGAELNADDVATLLDDPRSFALAEMMNVPGVLNHDTQCINKIQAALNRGKAVDGHAPLLNGDGLKSYIAAGISTDHEATTLEEGTEKIENGLKIIIRQGSTARNFDSLHPLIAKYPEQVMFCTDDQKACDLQHGHINNIVRQAVALGYDLFDVLRTATLNPVKHYHIPMGMLQVGDPADFIICDSIQDFQPKATYINGKEVSNTPFQPVTHRINHFNAPKICEMDIADNIGEKEQLHVIQAIDGQIITPHLVLKKGEYEDIQKIVVINRYNEALRVGIGYIRGMNLDNGALAQSIAHDSHHIIATGSNDGLIVKAVNQLIDMQGGIVVVDEMKSTMLSLPIAGLMSDKPAEEVADAQNQLLKHLHELHCPATSPIVALSFMQLIVIPELKITDQGLFDVSRFQYI